MILQREALEKLFIPPVVPEAVIQIKEKWEEFDPQQEMGCLQNMAAAYAGMIGKALPEKLRTAMLLMCGDHGIARYGVSAFPQEVTIQMIKNYISGRAGANVLARHAKTDIFITDVGVNADISSWPQVRNLKVALGTEDFTEGPAMTEKQALAGIAAGMQVADECIDKGYNLLATAEMGIANTTSTAAIAAVLLAQEPEQTVGRGSGINDERLVIKRHVVEKGISVNQPKREDALDVLRKVGGYDHAGLVGMILAGAARRVPTMVDGVNATAAALIAYGIKPQCADYLFCSHLSAENAHKNMLEILNLKPIVDAGMRLGEGTGANLAIVLLQSALDVCNHAESMGV